MALSNLRTEPRREITEQLIGMIAPMLFIAVDYGIARLAFPFLFSEKENKSAAMIFAMLIIPIMSGIMIAFIIAVIGISHIIGENICGFLARHGLDPRPKQRYRIDRYR